MARVLMSYLVTTLGGLVVTRNTKRFECFRKSVKRFSGKKHDKTKS